MTFKPSFPLNLCLAFLYGITSFGQQMDVDSLQLLLGQAKNPEEESVLHLHLAKAYDRVDLPKGRYHAKRALASSEDSIKGEAYNSLGRSYFFSNSLDSAVYSFKRSIALFQSKKHEDRAVAVGISLGAVQLRQGTYKAAVETLLKSVTFFEEVQDSVLMGKCYNNISSAYGELQNIPKAIDYGERALIMFKAKKMAPFLAVTLPNLAGLSLKVGDTLKAKSYLLEAEDLAKGRNDKFSLARVYNNLGNLYLETNYELSENYLIKALTLKQETGNQDGLSTLYNNLGYLYLNKEQPKKAVPYLEKGLGLTQGATKGTVYNNLSRAHKSLGNYEIALVYANQRSEFNDSILEVERQKAFAELSTKYETEKKEREILDLKNTNLETDIKRRQNRNISFAAIILLIAVAIFGYLWTKNTKRKRIIAEQQRELERQKVERLLKEHELIGLDAMMEGQEKERQRIAEDLHDNLGGKLSALKLQVDGVKQLDKKLYSKIKAILDESYDDVRNISHLKNGATILEKGLIPAVNIVADQLKSTKKLDIEVTNIDIKQKIKNRIEIQLFRTIQELLSNTLKHAKASQVNIQFSKDKNTLNVVYEDDGIGFDTSTKAKGLGLININNRVQKLEGTLNIDSGYGNGTTVIINVPL